MDVITTTIVSVAMWMTAMPMWSEGRIVNYGADHVVEANAEYRGYDLSPYWERCGVSVMSPADLGKVVWVRAQGGRWVGPCLAVDVSGRHDFYANVIVRQEIVEVADTVRKALGGFETSTWGEAWIGACPDVGTSYRAGGGGPDGDGATLYAPELEWTMAGERRPLFWPYPEQEWPEDDCWADRRYGEGAGGRGNLR